MTTRADGRALDLARVGDGGIEDAGGLDDEFSRIVAPVFTVEGDLHQVVDHLLADFDV